MVLVVVVVLVPIPVPVQVQILLCNFGPASVCGSDSNSGCSSDPASACGFGTSCDTDSTWGSGSGSAVAAVVPIQPVELIFHYLSNSKYIDYPVVVFFFS